MNVRVYPNGDLASIAAAVLIAGQVVDNPRSVLGLGSNGHIGFNEPAPHFTTNSYCVRLSEQTRRDNRRFFAEGEQVPTHALTMGIASIMQARRIVLVATGPNKAQAVKRMVDGPVDPMVPASILQMHRHATILLDADAAALL